MSKIKLMHGKLHKVRVTEANPEYMGSVTIDQELIDLVGILPLQEVQIVNITNGNRLSTYVIPGVAGSGVICINGAAAHLCHTGDLVIIIGYEECDRNYILNHGHQAKVLIADENNRCQDLLYQSLKPNQDSHSLEFHSHSYLESNEPKKILKTIQ